MTQRTSLSSFLTPRLPDRHRTLTGALRPESAAQAHLPIMLRAGLAPLVLLTAPASAQTTFRDWVANSGSWFASENWDPAAVPTLAETVRISNGGTAVIPAGAGRATAQRTEVRTGTLLVNDVLASASVPVGDFARLGGAGTIEECSLVYMLARSTLAPGPANGPGRLTTTGRVEFFGGVLEIDITGSQPGTGYDQLVITDSISFISLSVNPGYLTFGSLSGTFSISDRLFIVNNVGPGRVLGFFGGMRNGEWVPPLYNLGGFPQWRIYYTANAETNSLTGGNDVALSPEMVCYADCESNTGMGVLDIFDFLCFQNFFASGGAYACDCDAGTGPGVCDIFDFLCFQNAYDAGCP